ncbi:hypothetical protein [Kribbella capetownensis]|nr:hypothetical protein [Kribbella capetownensis]
MFVIIAAVIIGLALILDGIQRAPVRRRTSWLPQQLSRRLTAG